MVTALSADEAKIVRDTFKLIVDKSKETNFDFAYELFTQMVDNNPDLKALFKYGDVTETKAHTDNILSGLASIVAICDQQDKLDQALTKVNVQHKGLKINEEQYGQFAKYFVVVAKQLLHDGINESQHLPPWTKVLSMVREYWHKVA